MGGETFFEIAKGDTAQEAFDKAVKRAQYDHGHAGYTGTIAEKDSFVMIPMPANLNPPMEPREYARKLINDDDSRINDKWGAAGCIDLGNKQWMFFGWASS